MLLISLDFCLMGVIFPLTSLLDDDMMRRGVYTPQRFWAIALLPLFGPLLYLCWRPSLNSQQSPTYRRAEHVD